MKRRNTAASSRGTRSRRTSTSPQPLYHTGAGERYPAYSEIVEELNALEEEAKATDAALKEILKKIVAIEVFISIITVCSYLYLKLL